MGWGLVNRVARGIPRVGALIVPSMAIRWKHPKRRNEIVLQAQCVLGVRRPECDLAPLGDRGQSPSLQASAPKLVHRIYDLGSPLESMGPGSTKC